MRRPLYLLLLLLLSGSAAHAAKLSDGEWFIDSDPGRGAGTAFALPDAPSAISNVTIPAVTMNALAQGYHLLGVRTLDDSGEWGHVVWRSFHKDVAPESPRRLAGGEWFIDTDPGVGMGTTFAVPETETASFMPQIPASVLDQFPAGYHLLGVRLLDDVSRWGPVVWRSFHIDPFPAPAADIESVEYRIFRASFVVSAGTASSSPPGSLVDLLVSHGNAGLLLDAEHLLQVVPINISGQRGHAVYASFTYREAATPEIADALDTPGRDYFLDGNGDWIAQAITTHDGVDAVQSGAIGHSQQTWFETTLTGPGNLSFWWKVSSEANWDHLEFFINEVLQPGRISGNVEWTPKSYVLAAGNHVLRWRYTKDGGVAVGSDAGWVDQLVWVPDGTSQTFAAAIAAAGLTGNDALPNSIPFNDGVENLLKYAFNMNLGGTDAATMAAGGTAGLPTISQSGTGAAGVLRFEFIRRKGSGLAYTPKKSTSLDPNGWTTLTAAPTVTPIGTDGLWERVIYEEPSDPAVVPVCFGRVEVAIP